MDPGDNHKGTDSDNRGDTHKGTDSDNRGDNHKGTDSDNPLVDTHKGTDSDNPGDSGSDNHPRVLIRITPGILVRITIRVLIRITLEILVRITVRILSPRMLRVGRFAPTTAIAPRIVVRPNRISAGPTAERGRSFVYFVQAAAHVINLIVHRRQFLCAARGPAFASTALPPSQRELVRAALPENRLLPRPGACAFRRQLAAPIANGAARTLARFQAGADESRPGRC